MRKQFAEALSLELIKYKPINVDVNLIIVHYEDMTRCLEEEIEEEHETNQQCAGMKKMFQGYMVKDWAEIDFNYKKCPFLNKIIVKSWCFL